MTMSGKQKRFLRGLGHGLSATVQIGKEGLTDALVAALDQALLDHELVKVRLGANALIERKEAGRELAEKTGAVLAQVLGSTLLLYRAHPDEPSIRLP